MSNARSTGRTGGNATLDTLPPIQFKSLTYNNLKHVLYREEPGEAGVRGAAWAPDDSAGTEASAGRSPADPSYLLSLDRSVRTLMPRSPAA